MMCWFNTRYTKVHFILSFRLGSIFPYFIRKLVKSHWLNTQRLTQILKKLWMWKFNCHHLLFYRLLSFLIGLNVTRLLSRHTICQFIIWLLNWQKKINIFARRYYARKKLKMYIVHVQIFHFQMHKNVNDQSSYPWCGLKCIKTRALKTQ